MKRPEWKLSPCFSQLGSSMPCSTWQIRSSGACCSFSFLELLVTGQVLAPPTLPRHPSFPWSTDLSGPGAGNRDYNYPDSSCLGQMDNWLFPDSLLGWLNTITVHKVFWNISILVQTEVLRTRLKWPL